MTREQVKNEYRKLTTKFHDATYRLAVLKNAPKLDPVLVTRAENAFTIALIELDSFMDYLSTQIKE